MLSETTIAETREEPLAVVPLLVKRADMMASFPPAVMEIFSTLKAQGIAPAGPLFAHYLRMPTDTFEFEVGFPVASAIVAAGRVEPRVRPVQRLIQATYRGPYQGLHGAWGEFQSVLVAGGYGYAEDFWEFYLNDPTTAKPEDLLTVLGRVLV